MDLNQFKTSNDLANDGVWMPMHDDAEMKIASSGTDNVAYSAAVREAVMKPNLIGDGPPPEDMRDAAADHLVKGWKNLTLGGKEFPYSKENARALLRDFAPIYNFVINRAGDYQKFRADQMDVMEGN